MTRSPSGSPPASERGPCAACTRSLSEGLRLECRSCGRRYHERCWLPGCVEESCTNEYHYRVLPGLGPRGVSTPARMPAASARPRSIPPRLEPPTPSEPPPAPHAGHVLYEGRVSFEAAVASSWSARTPFGLQLCFLLPGLFLFVSGAKLGGGATFLGWVLWMMGVLFPVLHGFSAAGEVLRVVLEEEDLYVSAGERVSFRVPRSARMRITPRGFFKAGYELRWRGGLFESRLVLPALPEAQRAAFRAWCAGAVHSAEAPQASTAIAVRSATEHQTCPLCHDGVVGDLLERGACSSCGAHYHQACWEEFGGCALPSCRGLVAGARPREALRLLSSEDARSA